MGKDYAQTRNYSESVAALIDEEMKKVIDEGYRRCEEILSSNMELLDEVAKVLLEKEKIEGDEFEDICCRVLGIERKHEEKNEKPANESESEADSTSTEKVNETKKENDA